MKYTISFLGILVLIISGTLFFQYQVYSGKLDTSEGAFSYTQEIEITYRSGSLDIRQHFNHLSNEPIEISWPNLSVSSECFLETETSCDRLSEDKTKFEAGESRSASLSYIIPLDGGLTSNRLLKDIFVSLHNGTVSYTTVHISTDNEVLGQWVTGLPLIGKQTLSLVNYTMFSGTGAVSEIYWQAKEMNVQEVKDGLSIYSHTPINADLSEQLSKLTFLNNDHIAIVHDENRSGQQGERINFLDDLSITSINQNVLLSQAKTQYDFEGSPEWLSEVVTSFLTSSSIGSDKSIEIVNTLKNQMSESQVTSWIEKLYNLKGEHVSAKQLDEVLSSIFGLHTDYLTMNELTENVYPFIFHDEREVYVGTEKQPDVHVVFKDGLILYSLDSLLKSLGYQTSEGENGFYVQNKTQTYRFPLDYGFYVYNEQRYNVISEPIRVVADTFYIDEIWLQRLFNVDIQKSDSTITVKATATIQ